VLWAAGSVSTAAAQPIPGGAYGGGGLSAFPRQTSPDPGKRVVSLRVAPDASRVGFEFEASGRCSRGGPRAASFPVSLALTSAGTFRGAGVRRLPDGYGRITSIYYHLGGSIDGPRAAGYLRVITLTHAGRYSIRCDSGTLHWEARTRPAALDGTPDARPGLGYYGISDQPGTYRPFPITLRVSPAGGQVEQTLFVIARSCVSPRRTYQLIEAQQTRMVIAPDGSFSSVEKFPDVARTFIEYHTVTVTGRFAALGVSGTLRDVTYVRRRGGTAVIDRCDSGVQTFTAVP
jgi:hypothetical protein